MLAPVVDVTILLAGIFGAFVAIGATVAIEKLGGRLGGLLASVPSTIVPASVGFALAASEGGPFEKALHAVPAGMLVNAGFLYAWRVLPRVLRKGSLKVRLLQVTAVSLLAWAVLAALLVLVMREDFLPSEWMGFGFFLVQIVFGVWACRDNPPAPKGSQKVRLSVLASRGVLAGLAIGVSVWIASQDIPFVAGMASIFPAIFMTTMVSVWLAQGEAVQAGAVGPMMLGSASVSAYALAAAYLMPWCGVTLGAILSWLLAVALVSWPTGWWLRRGADS